MSDSDLLRRAATKARETAKAATPGPWTAEEHHTPAKRLKKQMTLDGTPPATYCAAEVHPVVELEGNGDGGTATAADADHIALWHPGVALAVATWLEDAARAAEENRDGWPEASYQKDPDWYENLFASEFHHPLAVARALLNHPEDT